MKAVEHASLSEFRTAQPHSGGGARQRSLHLIAVKGRWCPPRNVWLSQRELHRERPCLEGQSAAGSSESQHQTMPHRPWRAVREPRFLNVAGARGAACLSNGRRKRPWASVVAVPTPRPPSGSAAKRGFREQRAESRERNEPLGWVVSERTRRCIVLSLAKCMESP